MATWSDIKTRVENDLDMVDEDFINATEMLGYANEAINAAESLILNLSEDYLLAKPVNITLASGTSIYSLPAGIYAQKIRSLVYDNGSVAYAVQRVKNLHDIAYVNANDDYMYMITNDATSGMQLNLYPTPAESGALMKLYYLRNVNELAALTDVLDLPEAFNYIVQFVKDKCINKERMTPDAPKSAALTEKENLFVSSLLQRTPDEQNFSDEDLRDAIWEAT